MRVAKENLPVMKDRNPEGTSNYPLYCSYYHTTNLLTCNILGHHDCRNIARQMKRRIKEERKVVLDTLEKEALQLEVEQIRIQETFYKLYLTFRISVFKFQSKIVQRIKHLACDLAYYIRGLYVRKLPAVKSVKRNISRNSMYSCKLMDTKHCNFSIKCPRKR